MSREKQMLEDLIEIFDEEYERRRLITPQNTAEKMTAKGYLKQEWISVEERLPEEDGCYITYTNATGKDNGVIAQNLVTRNIRGKKIRRWEWQTRISPWIVTHWMPLPEAPKMKGGAE